MKKIGILGAGNWGTVLSIIAAQQDQEVFLYDRNKTRVEEINFHRENKKYLPGIKIPNEIHITSDLRRILGECQLILPVVPSSAFRQFTQNYGKFTRGDHLIVHGTKGLEPETHKRMSQILLEETATLRVGSLSGPNLAMELANQQPGASVVASRFNDVIEATQQSLSSSWFRVYGNYDLVGVELAGAFKNILAIAAGMIHELGFGKNALAMLLTRGLGEIGRLITSMGAQSSTLLGLAGIGDVIATSTSPLSRNFQAGVLLAQGRLARELENILGMTIEGLNTINVAMELSTQKKIELPITKALYTIAMGEKKVREAMDELMQRPTTFEFSDGE